MGGLQLIQDSTEASTAMLLTVAKRDDVGDALQRDEAMIQSKIGPVSCEQTARERPSDAILARRRSTKDGEASARAGSLR